MDNICHTLAGAAFGEAGLKRRTRFGSATLMIASNLPDLDVLVFVTSTPAVAFRRGWTHGVAAQLLLPVVLTAVMLLAAHRWPGDGNRGRGHVGWLLALSYLGVVLHVLMDLLNNYGVRLLAPFDWRWFYGDALFIIDPWLWLLLGVGIWLARRRRRPSPARMALLAAAIYVAVAGVSARAARVSVIETWRSSRGADPRALMVGPVPVTPLRREVIVDAGAWYETGTFTWPGAETLFDAARIPKHDDDPRVAMAQAAPNIRAFLVWARFPFWTFDEADGGTLITVSDVRFAGRGATFQESTLIRSVDGPR